jgi:hypothetical protein
MSKRILCRGFHEGETGVPQALIPVLIKAS